MALTDLLIATSYDVHSKKGRDDIESIFAGYHAIKNHTLSPKDTKKIAERIARGENPKEAPPDYDEKLDSNTLMDRKVRNQVVSLYNIFADIIPRFNPAIIKYLSEAAKQEKIKFFKNAFIICLYKNEIDEIEHRGHAFKENRENIDLCIQFIDRLTFSLEENDKKTRQLRDAALPSCSPSDGAIPLAAGKDAAEVIYNSIKDVVNQIKSLKGKISGIFHEIMCRINERRLYWVWGGGMLTSILVAIPETFYNVSNTTEALDALSPYTGALSWILYYARFGLSLFLVLKHTIANPWMSDEERAIPWKQRFLTQWEQRKFSLLNDFIWATANFVCFLWLNGSGMLGYAGNVLTAGLLMMDLCLTMWKFCEAKAKHEATMELFRAEKKILKGRLNKKEWLQGQLDTLLNQENVKEAYKFWHSQLEEQQNDEGLPIPDNMTIAGLQKLKENLANEINHIKDVQLPNNEMLQDATERKWSYQQYGLINDLAYAAGLLLAFSVVCCLFFPPAVIAPSIAMIIGIVGGALCFTLGLACAAISNGLEIAKTRRQGKDAHQECQEKLKQYVADLKDNKLDELKAKELYLEMKGLRAETRHQEKMVIYQSLELVRSLFIDACIPLIIFASLTFLPLGIGLGVLAAGFAVGIISKRLVNTLVPEKGDHIEFKKEEYQDFRSKLQACTADKDVPLEVLDNKPKAKGSCFTLFGTKEANKEAGDLSSLNPNLT